MLYLLIIINATRLSAHSFDNFSQCIAAISPITNMYIISTKKSLLNNIDLCKKSVLKGYKSTSCYVAEIELSIILKYLSIHRPPSTPYLAEIIGTHDASNISINSSTDKWIRTLPPGDTQFYINQEKMKQLILSISIEPEELPLCYSHTDLEKNTYKHWFKIKTLSILRAGNLSADIATYNHELTAYKEECKLKKL